VGRRPGHRLQDIQIDLANAAGGLTQYNSQSVVQSVNTNGTAFGNLTNIEVDDEGYVSAIFDNGVTRRIAQVAIATFSNPNGLKGVNGNAYRVTNESGTYSLKTPGWRRRGLDCSVHAGSFDGRLVDRVHGVDHDAESLFGFVEDHHHR
jgi:flagellar hook-basal body protein